MRGSWTALVPVGLAVILAATVAHGATRSEPTSAGSPRRGDNAKTAVATAMKAAKAGDFATALTHFERAMQLKPSPRLHKNIAICHHQLMATSAEGSQEQLRHAAAAIEAYNRYLEQAQDPPDRTKIERSITNLGGTPITQREDWVVQRIDPDPDEPPPALEPSEVEDRESPVDTTEAEPAPPAKQPRRPSGPRARVGGAFLVAAIAPGTLASNDDIEGLPGLGAGFYAGAYVGRRRQLNVGGELFLHGSTRTRSRDYGLVTGHLGLTVDYAWVFGKTKMFEVGVGGLAALAGQGLRIRSFPSSPTRCPDGDPQASQRGGLLLGGRIAASVLLGRERNHAVVLRVGPGVALMGKGSRDKELMDCQGGAPTPFAELGFGEDAYVAVLADLGYAGRF